jgi:hypothetical protein
MALVTMDTDEFNRLRIIQDLGSRRTTPKAAAAILGITSRQIRRLPRRYMAQAAAGLASRRRCSALPSTVLNRMAGLEPAEIERRVLQVAEDLAHDIDRELKRVTAILDTRNAESAGRVPPAAPCHPLVFFSRAISRLVEMPALPSLTVVGTRIGLSSHFDATSFLREDPPAAAVDRSPRQRPQHATRKQSLSAHAPLSRQFSPPGGGALASECCQAPATAECNGWSVTPDTGDARGTLAA